VLDQKLACIRHYSQHSSLLAFVAATQYLNGIVAVNVNSFVYRRCRCSHMKIRVFKVAKSV